MTSTTLHGFVLPWVFSSFFGICVLFFKQVLHAKHPLKARAPTLSYFFLLDMKPFVALLCMLDEI